MVSEVSDLAEVHNRKYGSNIAQTSNHPLRPNTSRGTCDSPRLVDTKIFGLCGGRRLGLFELVGGLVIQRLVDALGIVKGFNVFEDAPPGFFETGV